MTARAAAEERARQAIREEAPDPSVPTPRLPLMVPVQRGVVEELQAAVADWRASSGGQVGECRDAVVAVAVALADELEESR